jgi:hypothetical protein
MRILTVLLCLTIEGTLVAQDVKPTLDDAVIKVLQKIAKSREGDEPEVLAQVQKLLKRPEPEADRALVILLQFANYGALPAYVEARIIERGKRMLPLLWEYRETRFPFTGTLDEPMGISGRGRREVFDKVIAKIQGTRARGVRPEVYQLLRPVLGNMTKMIVGPVGTKYGELFTNAYERLFENQSEAADEAIALLLDFRRDAGYSFDLRNEIVARGRRMLPYLRRMQMYRNFTLLRHYSRKIWEDWETRTEDLENLIQEIELGSRR